MAISYAVSTPDRIIEIVLVGDVTGEEYVDFHVRLAKERPESLRYDEIIDLTRYTGDIDNASVKRLAERARARGEAPSGLATYMVTHDSQFDSWVAYLASMFPHRSYRVARSTREAYRRLTAGRAAGGASSGSARA